MRVRAGAVVWAGLLLATAAGAQDAPPPVAPEAPAAQTAPAAPSVPVTEPASVPAAETPVDAPAAEATPTPEAQAQNAPAPAAEAPVPAAEPILPAHDLSVMGMYRQADWVVKAVMLLLLAACFATWTVFLFKTVLFAGAKSRLRHSSRQIREGVTLASVAKALDGRRDPASFMVHAALDELRRSDAALDVAGVAGVKERVRSIVERIEAQAGRRMRKGTGILASVGSVGPFVGLFGTVWGIMNAFIGIAESNTTNLAVVAPGIAEALLATAIGLVAAIPAVVIYNTFARRIAGYKQALGDAGAGVERLLSRDLDFRHAPHPSPATE
ncbi:tonB-system energizer ExbB [Falsirhodobacter sp. 20TX0035]|uniref:tonB-system energizer ExbB n=1 Tax=Falsirhodobacter sp. 20TX0035 TaxID=3022019 RepID=UPI002330450E|nr:tonB-system energizer ExbB [Falsirhodobacter sp. 20TX0035]MDB6453941.1 tonB-system energizer ExbB [Falsirhodobacter sp. 20TX0035]